LVLVEQAVLPAHQVLRDFKVYAVKPASLDPLALPEVVDREVSPVSPEKMVNLEKTVNLDPLALLDLQALEAYQECPVCPESKATVVSPVWTDPKENPARVVKREHKV